MGLVVVVIGVLSQDDSADVGERRMARPGVDFFERRKDLLARVDFTLQEAFEVEEGGGGDFIAEVGEPGGVERVEF